MKKNKIMVKKIKKSNFNKKELKNQIVLYTMIKTPFKIIRRINKKLIRKSKR